MYTKISTPERLLDHFSQMKEDLTQIRFYISKHYKQLVEDPSNRRQEVFHYNYVHKCKQSEKLEKRIN